MISFRHLPFAALVLPVLLSSMLNAETGYDAWLRYKPLNQLALTDTYDRSPSTVVKLGNSSPLNASQDELIRGIRGLLGRTLRTADAPVPEDMIVLGTIDQVHKAVPNLPLPTDLITDGYAIQATGALGRQLLLVTASNDRGVLYGVFALLRHIALHKRLSGIDEESNPYAPVRWVNEWNNLDGSIERGYGGRSIFFENDNVVSDLARAADYARLLASTGINGCTINNVNANPRVLTSEFLPQLVRVADAFRPWGVSMSISVDLGSPKSIGGLDTFDPLDPRVEAWWKEKVNEIYRAIPDFGGFVLKADSEGRVGPSTYGRTHADAANVLANALKPHGGIVIYRGFVYNHHMDWRNLKNDRARAAYDNFHPLDGKFVDNATVQIKYGPIDFQAREPVSPLIGALQHSNETLELQITQEYTGQQRHLCFLVPMWKQILDFNLRVGGADTPVKDIVSGKTFHRPLGGLVGVANVGRDPNWLGADLAMANLYGFGQLAWNPDISASQIAEDWTRLTFGDDARVVDTVVRLELESWPVYEGYTGPLGLGTLTDILRGHYGPGIESAERNGWGQWIRADRQGIGMDRTVATGTGYIGQYPPDIARVYESLATCPDNLLLFMHHVPYTHVLHSGKTVIQHVYDSHYEAVAEAQQFPQWWRTLRGRIDDQRFANVLTHLTYQAGHAVVWRDAICTWFLQESGIPDQQGRTGHFPDRVEAEAMHLDGYTVEEVTPPEDASGAKAVGCGKSLKSCTATVDFKGVPGWYNLNVEYFDLNTGIARFDLFVGSQLIKSWVADQKFPAKIPKSDTSVREQVSGIALRPNDQIRIVGTPDGGDNASLDYVEIAPQPFQ